VTISTDELVFNPESTVPQPIDNDNAIQDGEAVLEEGE